MATANFVINATKASGNNSFASSSWVSGATSVQACNGSTLRYAGVYRFTTTDFGEATNQKLKLNVTLSRVGGGDNKGAISCRLCTSDIFNGSVTSVESAGTFLGNMSSSWLPDYPKINGTYSVSLRPNTTYYILICGAYYSDGMAHNLLATLNSIAFEYTIPFSKCTAPTSISCAARSVKNQTTISWGGAEAGNSNPITGYYLYVDDVLYGEKIVETSVVYPWDNADRGKTLNFKIQTIGTQAGYDSDISQVFASTVLNELPNAPILNSKTVSRANEAYTNPDISTTDKDSAIAFGVYRESGTEDDFANITSTTLFTHDVSYDFKTVDGEGEYSLDLVTEIPFKWDVEPLLNCELSSETTQAESEYNHKVNINVISISPNSSLAAEYKIGDGNWLQIIPSNNSILLSNLAGKSRNKNWQVRVYSQNSSGDKSSYIYSSVLTTGGRPIMTLQNEFNGQYNNHFFKKFNVSFNTEPSMVIQKLEVLNQIVTNGLVGTNHLFEVPDLLPSNQSINVRITTKTNFGEEVFERTVYTVRDWELNKNLASSISLLHGYKTNTDWKIVSFFSAASLEEAYLDNDPYDFYLCYGNKQSKLRKVSKVIEDGSINHFMDGNIYNICFNELSGLGLQDNVGRIDARLRLEITDVFNRIFTSEIALPITTKEPVEISRFSLAPQAQVFEGQELNFSYEIRSYNKTNYQAEILIARENSNSLVPTNWENYKTFSVSSDGRAPDIDTPLIINKNEIRVVGSISSSKYIYFKFRIDGVESTPFYFSRSVAHYEIPNLSNMIFSAKKFRGAENTTIGVEIEWDGNIGIDPINILGGGYPIAKLYLSYLTESGEEEDRLLNISSSLTSHGGYTNTSVISFNREAFIPVRLCLETQARSGGVKYRSYSPYIYVYNTVATFSYRKNKFAINSNQIDDLADASLIIGAVDEKDKVYVFTRSGQGTIELDGAAPVIDNFILDGGSW